MLATTTTTTTTAALTLSHNQEVRVKGFSHLANRITVGTARGYAAQYNEDTTTAHQRALDNGHDTAWTNQAASVLTSDYPGKHEALDAAAAATAAAPEIEEGMVVEIEGELFTVKVLGERYCDPVKFVRLPVQPKPLVMTVEAARRILFKVDTTACDTLRRDLFELDQQTTLEGTYLERFKAIFAI